MTIIYNSAIFCTYLFYIRFRGPCIRHLQKALRLQNCINEGHYWNLIAFFLEVCIIWCIIAYNFYIATLTLIARRYHEYWYLLAYSKDNSLLIVIITTPLQCAQGIILYCKTRSACRFKMSWLRQFCVQMHTNTSTNTFCHQEFHECWLFYFHFVYIISNKGEGVHIFQLVF